VLYKDSSVDFKIGCWSWFSKACSKDFINPQVVRGKLRGGKGVVIARKR